MTKTILTIALVLAASVAQAQNMQSQTTFRDRDGRFDGTAITHGNTTSVYDRNGWFVGTTITHGSQTSVYDKGGHFQGTATQEKKR